MVIGAAFTGETVKLLALHIEVTCAGISGLGLTVTITVNVDPGQLPPIEGVTVYVAVCAVFVGLFNVPLILI